MSCNNGAEVSMNAKPLFSEPFAAITVVWRGILNSLLSSTVSAFSVPNSVKQRPFIVQSSILKGMLCSLTCMVKTFVLFVFRVSNLAFILRSFQLKTTASANLKVILKTVCMSHVHTKRLPTATPSISPLFCVILIMAGHITWSNYRTAFYSKII